MTTIAAWADLGWGVAMAADDAVGYSSRLDTDARKISVITVPFGSAPGPPQRALLAACGRAALNQVARYAWAPQLADDDWSEGDYDRWAHHSACQLEQLAREARLVDKDDDVDGSWLLGFRGRLWHLAEHYAWRAPAYDAIGSGNQTAIGALDALAPWPEFSIDQKVHRAVEIACTRDPHSLGPVRLEVIRVDG